MSEEKERSGIMTKKEKLETYDLIDSPKSRVELIVAQNVTLKHLYTGDNETPRYIVNLKAIALDQVEELLKKFAEADEIPVEELNGLTLTGSIWVNNGVEPDHLPIKGEKVDCSIDFVRNQAGEAVLRVISLNLRPADKTSKVSFEELFEKYGVLSEEDENVEHTV